MSRDLAASVRAKLLNIAKAERSDFNQVLIRYALERFLYRLGQSNHADHFLLKGALLFALWYDMPHRPTRDVDLLGFGASDLKTLKQVFTEIANISVPDGISFDASSIQLETIRKEAGYTGARINMSGELAKARFKTQIDIGFGDAVTPGPVQAIYPVLIADFPAPSLRAYPVYSVISEKLHAIALLGMANSRLKDYWDMQVIFERENLDANILAQAIAATFSRRGMAVPTEYPIGLSDEFANDPSRQAMWQAFLRKNGLPSLPLVEVIATLGAKLQPALGLAAMPATEID